MSVVQELTDEELQRLVRPVAPEDAAEELERRRNAAKEAARAEKARKEGPEILAKASEAKQALKQSLADLNEATKAFITAAEAAAADNESYDAVKSYASKLGIPIESMLDTEEELAEYRAERDRILKEGGGPLPAAPGAPWGLAHKRLLEDLRSAVIKLGTL